MAGSFVENVNLLASKIDVVEEANSLFDEGVIPILEEIAVLDLDEAIQDLKKGNYLGNRKIDINLALNIQGITQDLIDKEPEQAEAIWTNPSNTVLYNKATATFVDGTVIELPFLFDGNPVTISTHGDLLAQLSRLDYVYAQAQVDSLYQITVGDNTDYIITIDNEAYTYTSGVGATRGSIIAGIANMINAEAIPITANVTDLGSKLTLTANIAGNPFYAEVSPNMAISTITPNIIEGPKETEFLAKLTGTLAANFASPVVGELVKIYDIIGQNSNLERLQLHAISGRYVEEAPLYYWAKTTSAFQTLSMRANDIIKLGNEIDKIIKLASSIDEVIEVQNHLPQLVDTFDANGNPNGDQTIYNALTELKELHSKLTDIITVYNDMKVGGNNYIQSVASDLQTANTIGVVAEDLNLGVDSTVKNVGNNITSVVTVSDNISSVNTTADNIADVNLVASEIVPNLDEILQADTNAEIATNKALEATNAAAVATAKNNEIKNVSVGNTITGAAGTNASVVYNPANGKFTFVVPQGKKGDKGDAFQVNSIGTLSQRALYDNQLTGFSFLAVDVIVDGSPIPHIYFKLSSSSGDWSVGIPFGRGDKGDMGDAGNGITQIVFTSTSHASGLAGQSGGTDTYTISYTDSSTDTFVVYNGLDAGDASKIVFEPEGDITSTNVQLAIQEVRDNTDIKLGLKQDTLTFDIEPTVGSTNPVESSGIFNALSNKQDTLISGTNIKTINGQSVLGNGDFELQAGATVVETLIGPNEIKTVYTDNTVTVGGLNVSIMEEDVSTVETAGVFEPTYGNVDDFDSKNYALVDTLTISGNTAVLGTSDWDVGSVNKTIYEKGGRGKATVLDINGNTATINIITPFSKNTLNSGDWFMYSFLLNNNGDITLSKGGIAEYVENIKYANAFNPSATTTKNNIMSQTDNLGTTHICFIGNINGITSLCYGMVINGVYYEEVNILNSSLYSTAINSDNFYMLVDSNRTVHIAFTYTKDGQTDIKLVYGYKTENGEWTEIPEVNQLSLATTGYPILNETTTGNVDIITKEESILQFYRKTGGIWHKYAITQWDSNLIGSSRRDTICILNLPDGAFEMYSGTDSNIYCCGYDGVSLFYKGSITIPSDHKNRGFIVEQDGVYRNLICGLQRWGGSNSYVYESYVLRFNSRKIGDFTKSTKSITKNLAEEQIDKLEELASTIDNVTKFNFYKDKITNDIYILCMYIGRVSSAGNKSRVLIKRVDDVWYTRSNSNSIIYSAPFTTTEGRLHYISGYGICEVPINGGSFIYDLGELKPPFCTPIIKNNATYNDQPLITMFLRIDNEGYMHGVFEQGIRGYPNNYIPCYITNRTETGEFIIDYNFSNPAVIQRVSGLTVDANGVPYVLFAGWAAKCIWKKVNGVWDGNYSVGSAINIASYSLQRDEGRLFRVEHINGDEYIYINGYMLNTTNSRYYPCEYKLVNRIMSATVLDNMFIGIVSASFNTQKMLWYTSKSNVTVFMPMQGNMMQGNMQPQNIYIYKDGVVTNYSINPSSSSAQFNNTMPNFVTEDEDGNIIILFVLVDSGNNFADYTSLQLLIVGPNGNIVFNDYLRSFTPSTIFSFSYSIEEKRVYILGGSSATASDNTSKAWSIFYVDIAKALISTSITVTPTPYMINTMHTGYANCIAYNNVKQGVDGFISDTTLTNSHIVHMTSKTSSETYINNEYVHVHLPVVYTKYWYEISAKSIDYIRNGQYIDMSFSYNGNTYNVFKTGQTGNRKIVSNEGSITGLADGVWCYNSSTDYTLETWVEAVDKNEAFTLAKGIEINRMFNSDLIYSEISVNDFLYFTVSLYSNNSTYSPRFKNLKLFYLSLARWVDRTQNYEIYAQGVDAISVKSLDNETKHIKVVHNG